MKAIIRILTKWAWRDTIHKAARVPELEHELAHAKEHVRAMQRFMKDCASVPREYADEIDRLRRLCGAMRDTFRRMKGRTRGGTFTISDPNWPRKDHDY